VEPSVKGSVVEATVVALKGLRERGKVSAEQLAARVSKAALQLADSKIEAGLWYPIRPYNELVDFLWDLDGRSEEKMREAGARSADVMYGRGTYQQFEYADRVKRAPSIEDLLRQTKLISSVVPALYNFVKLEVRVSADRQNVEIVYSHAALFSDALRISTEGFMTRVNERQGSSRAWTSERTRPDEIVFRMRVPERLAGAS
jgi:hypothetical protein